MLNSFQVKKAIQQLEKNAVIILPTDTIYGLSAVISQENAQKINNLKKRELGQEIIVLFSRFNQIAGFVELTEQTITFLESATPTTVIFRLLGKSSSVGLRLVKRSDLKKIIDTVGPIFSTSVNNHGQRPYNTEEALTNFNPQIPVFFDGESANKPSRIYNSITGRWLR